MGLKHSHYYSEESLGIDGDVSRSIDIDWAVTRD